MCNTDPAVLFLAKVMVASLYCLAALTFAKMVQDGLLFKWKNEIQAKKDEVQAALGTTQAKPALGATQAPPALDEA